MLNNELNHTEFSVKSGERMFVNGVVGIESFDSTYLELKLSNTGMSVEGENMKIESLDHSNGELVIVGKIQGVFYSNGKKKSGFFSQIFG